MKVEELQKRYGKRCGVSHHNDEEHRIQCACVSWFRLSFRKYAELLFAIPNGSKRDAVTGKKLKDEGVLSGVADLFLAVPCNGYHGCWIEMKTRVGRQSESQKLFEQRVTSQGYQYSVCRSLTEFINVIKKYMSYE